MERLGQRIGEYEITARLGGGPYSHVYRATHERSGLVVAIKVLDHEVTSLEGDRALTEARAAAAIRHPNVVTVHDVGVTADRHPYIVMEYLDGETLAQRWQGQVPVADVLPIADAILRGLRTAHERGIVHRDLRAANVFVVAPSGEPAASASFTRTERVVIVDFGLAKVGADRAVGGRTDLHALGLMLFEALSGRPFDAGATSRWPSDVPRHVIDAIDRALARRFVSAQQMRAALTGRAREAAPRSRKLPWLAFGMALVAVAALAAALLLHSHRSAAPVPAWRGTVPDMPSPAPGGGSASVTITVPPALPGEPALGPDYDLMLQRFAANLSQGIYTRANLEFLLCNSEKGLAIARAAGPSSDPRVVALMRRMTALFRSAPGMAHAACP